MSEFNYLTEEEAKMQLDLALLQLALGLETCKTRKDVIELLKDAVQLGTKTNLSKSREMKIEKGLRAWQLVDLQHFLKEYLKKEKHQDVDYRIDLLIYNVAELIKSRVYKKAYGKFEVDIISKLADILMITLSIAILADKNLADVVNLGIQKYYEKEWTNKNKECLD